MDRGVKMITKRNDLLSQKVIQGLKNRHMNGYYVHTKQEAFDLVFELMKSDSSVGWGGSDTINSLGIKEELYKRDFKVIDRDKAKDADEKYNIERETFYADYYLMSTNAITEDGILVNMDGHCNRVACLYFGPKQVIMVVGMNKVTKDIDSAISRLRNVAAPINNQRFGGNRPCQVTGSCANCLAQGCISLTL